MPDWYTDMTPGIWVPLSEMPFAQYREIIDFVATGKLEMRRDESWSEEGAYFTYFFRRMEAINGI
jgi:hypothetical protein